MECYEELFILRHEQYSEAIAQACVSAFRSLRGVYGVAGYMVEQDAETGGGAQRACDTTTDSAGLGSEELGFPPSRARQT
jgi:hypothetical protein